MKVMKGGGAFFEPGASSAAAGYKTDTGEKGEWMECFHAVRRLIPLPINEVRIFHEDNRLI
jgi:hypothetical protein